MTEYFSKEIVFNEFGELFTLCRESLPNKEGHHYVTEEELEITFDHLQKLSIPSADVVAVVRCRDCIRADAYGHCEMQNFWGTRDDFCSRGEKKDGDNGRVYQT